MTRESAFGTLGKGALTSPKKITGKVRSYKAPSFGCWLDVVDRWFPSSKMCRKCHKVHTELKLSERIFICPSCGHIESRDLQAAKNLADAPDVECSRVGSTQT